MGWIVDNFAGGGGASTGIEAALGRAVDFAINHDEEAIRMHEVNHPGTAHIRNNIWQVDPAEVCAGRPVDLAWFSPDCKHFSKAKGGKPREKSIRDLAWVVVLWAQRVRPALILLENVEEFQTWGPLDEAGYPIKDRAGEDFAKWSRALRKEGYKLQFRELRACDYGAPTIRKRFFMVARCDGEPIVWPEPTHAPADPEERAKWTARQRKAGFKVYQPDALKPWRTAAEIIDWSIPCPSIFERKKALADKTLRRVAHGVMRFVVNNPRPFIVPLTHQQQGARGAAVDNPLATVTGANRGEQALVTPFFARTAHGDVDRSGKKRGQPCHGADEGFPTVTQSQDSALVAPVVAVFRADNPGKNVEEPLPTVTANSFVKRPGGAAPLGVVEAEIAPFATYAQQGGANRPLTEPLHTVTASKKDQNCVVEAAVSPVIVGCGGRRGQSAPVGPEQPMPTGTAKADACLSAAHLVHLGNGEREGQAPRAMDVEKPLGTVVAGGQKHAAVAAMMTQFRGSNASGGASADPAAPAATVTAGGTHQGIVCVHLEQANGSPEGERPLPGRSAAAPLATIVAKGSTQRVVETTLLEEGDLPPELMVRAVRVAAFLIKYYGNEQDGHGLDHPIATVTVQDRFAVVTVTIDATTYVIVDIGLRMLVPRELFNAQGFLPDYIIDRDAEGRPITKTAQVAKCGNSVCPPLAEALAGANWTAVDAEPEQVAA